MPESKIEATERLRAEGRWEEASAFREAERERLRDEGKTRKEAREGAWRLMLERYGPPDNEVFFTFRSLAGFPPPLDYYDSEEHAHEFVDLWWVYCVFCASVGRDNPGLFDHDRLWELIKRRLQLPQYRNTIEGAPERRDSLLRFAFGGCPLLFLELIGNRFRSVVEQIEQIVEDAAVREAIRSEFNFYLDRLPALREAAEGVSLQDRTFANGEGWLSLPAPVEQRRRHYSLSL